MRQLSIDQSRRTAHKSTRDNRRETERVPTHFSLMYSGMCDGRMLIGSGIVSNISQSGIGIHGNHPVKLGMDLSKLVTLPDPQVWQQRLKIDDQTVPGGFAAIGEGKDRSQSLHAQERLS